MGKGHWGGSGNTQGQSNEVTHKKNTAWTWEKMGVSQSWQVQSLDAGVRGVLTPLCPLSHPYPLLPEPRPSSGSHCIHAYGSYSTVLWFVREMCFSGSI